MVFCPIIFDKIFPDFRFVQGKRELFLSFQVTYSKTLWQNFTKTLFKRPHFGFIGGLYYSFQHNNFLENLPQTLFFPFLDLSLCKMEEKTSSQILRKATFRCTIGRMDRHTDKKHKQELPYRGSKTKTCSAEIHTLKHQSKTCLKMAII